jgi:hypothetical protein
LIGFIGVSRISGPSEIKYKLYIFSNRNEIVFSDDIPNPNPMAGSLV